MEGHPCLYDHSKPWGTIPGSGCGWNISCIKIVTVGRENDSVQNFRGEASTY